MFFDAGLAIAVLPELGERTRALMARLLPGSVTLVLPNPRGRYPLAGGDALGLRVPDVPLLRGVGRPVLQTSANVTGGPDARRFEGADLVIDAGELPGTPSTVIDLRRFEEVGEWAILRVGAVPAEDIRRAL
jgi:L-threonylcarbamoyladenylate synthase